MSNMNLVPKDVEILMSASKYMSPSAKLTNGLENMIKRDNKFAHQIVV